MLTNAVGGGTTSVTGTSASAAFVAGGAALLLGADRKATNSIVIGRLARTAHKSGSRMQTGNGRLDLTRALSDRLTTHVVPAGVAGRASGGPFVGPYQAAIAAPTPVAIGSASSASSATTTLTITSGVNVPVGSTIFIVGSMGSATAGAWTATDNLGTPNVYTQDALNTVGLTTSIISAPVTQPLASGKTITVTTPAATTARAISAFYVQGAVSLKDQTATSGSAANTTAFTTGTTAATANPYEFVVGAGGVNNAATTFTAPSCTASAAETTNTGIGLQGFYKQLTATGTQACTATLSATGPYGGAIAAFKFGPTPLVSGTSAAASATLALTLTDAVPVNSTIFVLAAQNFNSATAMTAADNLGTHNTFTADANINNGTRHITLIRATVTQALAAGSIITITYPSATGVLKMGEVLVFRGLLTTSPIDGAVGQNTGSSVSATATTGGTTQASDLVFGGITNPTVTVNGGNNSCTAGAVIGTAGTMQEAPVFKNVNATGAQICGGATANSAWAAVAVAYKMDVTAPTAAVTFPSNAAYNATSWSGAVTGSATDETGGSGIDVTAGVTLLSIHDDTANKYWSGAAWGAAAGPEVYFNPTSGPSTATPGSAATWSYTFPIANLTNGDNYTIHTKTADYAENASAVASKTFNYDTTAPTASFTIVPGTNPLYQYFLSGSNRLYYNPTVAGDFKIDGSASSDAGSGLASTIFPGIGTTANTAMTQSPVLFWRFSENAGTTVADSSGYGNTGVASGGYTRNTTPGAFSNDTDPAITFTAASNGKVVGASPSAIPSGNASRSEVVWFKTTTTTEQALASYGCTDGVTGCAAGQNFGFMVIPSANNLMFWGWGDDLTFSTSAVVANTADGNWHQAVITYNGGTNSVTAYLDGTSLGSQTPATALNTMPAGVQGFNVGVGVPVNDASNGGKYFNGSLDDVSVYSVVLTPAQITAQYAARALPSGFTGVGAVATATPWQSPSYAWTTSATTAPGAETLLAADVAGNKTSVTLTYVADTTAPTGGAFTANGVAATTVGSTSTLTSGTTIPINSRTDYTEAQSGTTSGLKTSTLTIQSATLTGNVCGAYGSGTTIVGTTAPTVADGNCYLLTLTGTDNVTNVATPLTTVAKVDETAATASVTTPSASAYNAAGWSGSLTGTAADTATGVSAVKVSIQDTTVGGNSCWNGTTFTAACPNYIAAAGTTSWSYALASGAFTNGHSYTETVQTTDVAGNANNSAATATWAYDTSAPSSATLTTNGVYNATGWPGAISGTVSDSGAGSHGISAVNVSIADSVSGKCWNGTNFTTAACQNWIAVTSGGSAAGAANANWSYTLAAGALTDGHTYTVSVQATDATTSGNQSGTLAAGTFVYDTSAPSSATLTTNGNYNTAGWPGAISGTVSDSGTGSHGISAVNVSIADSVSGKCWNGTNFTTAACQNWIAVTSGGSAAGAANANWSYTLAAGALTDGHTYTVSVQASDATTSGNQSGTLAAGTFVFDSAAPGSATLTTIGNYNTSGWPGAISGTVSDSGTGSHGISAVNVSIADSVSGKCWNGTNFTTAACQNWLAVTSGGSAAGAANANWSYNLVSAALTDGHTYTVSVQATDATTSGNQSGTLAAGTFTFDTSAPSSAALTTNGNYNTSGWPGTISGTVSDSGTGSHGISAVNVSIQDSVSGKCWNGTNFTTAACQNWVAVTSGGSAAGAANANWSYTLASAALTDGHTYTVSVQATDATSNGNQSGTLAAGTFTYDTSAPNSATLTTNGVYNAAGWPGAISGTVSDSGTGSHGISSVNVSIADSVSGKCWNGTDFTTAACQNWIAVTSGGSAAGASNANWSYTLAAGALTDGHTYTVSVQATDATTSGNQSGTLSASTFVYDASPPNIATLTTNASYNAAGWPGAISGTTTDSGTGSHGISAVKVSIQDSSSGKCWNGADFTTAACPNYIAVTSGGSAAGAANANWSYTLAAAALTNGDTYTVQVQATDATTSGNTSGNLAAGSFTYDTSAPSTASLTSNGTYNAAGWPGAITGTTNDSATGSHGISSVNVSIQDSTSGKCWNGTNFTTATCPNWVAVTSGGSAAGAANANWSYALAAAALTNGDTYTVQVQSTDATTSGNTSGTLAASTFVYDTAAPSSATLTTNGVYNATGWPGAISGTVSDSGTGGHGISAVNVSIQDSVSGKCWNGTNFTTAACQNWVAVTSGGSAAGAANANWSYALASGALTDGHTYTVSVQATDATTSGNQSGTLPAGTFVYDTSAPSSATLTTNGVYNAAGWPGAISGTVSDSGTGSHGISAVNVSIADSVSGKCWNGTNFTTVACQNWVAVTSGGSAAGAANANWSYTLASGALTDGHTYTVSVQASDATTSGNQSGTLAAGTFVYDNSAPNSATLTTNGNYNTAGWPGAISGTVSDSGTGSHGISAVNISIADSVSGKCWNGTDFTTAACQNWLAVTSGGSAAGAANANWSYNLVSAALTDGHAYTVSVQATDATTSGNQSGTLAAGTFTFDSSAPSSATLTTNGVYNATGWPGAISGTVSDSGTGSHGISAVNVSIADSVSGKCWNGTNFTTAACQNWIAVTSGGSAAGAANANWSYTLAAGALTDGHTYTVSVQATDATNTGNQSGTLAAGTFVYDTSAPSSATLTTNGNYNATGWPGAISGTVSDFGTGSHGISAVNISIADSVSGKCWNGANFTTAACQNWLAVTSGGSAAGAGNANWSYTLAAGALTDGHTYTVSVRATDATTSGNQSGTLAAGTFTYDTSAPSSATLTSNAVYNAAGWPGSISGTVSDSGTGSHGISAVNVSIADSVSGKCWNGTNFTTAACQNWLAVTNGGSAAGAANANWSYTLASAALTDGHTYTVSVQATDATNTGNTSGTLAAGTFVYDNSAPNTASLTSNGVYNAAGWPGAITGTTADSGTGSHGISAVNVSIQDSTSGKCWNGTNFTTATCPNYIAVTSGGSVAGAANANWSYTLAAAALTSGDTYTVQVQSTDATTNGNTSGNLAAGTFTYDTAAPSSATLSSNGIYNAAGWPGAITGTVSDSGTGGHGISAVNVSIADSVSGKCWNGTNFTTAACQNWLAVTSGGSAAGAASANWSYTLAAAALTDGHTYTVSVQATDATTSGNQSGTLSAGTFVYDNIAPSAATLSSNGIYNAAGWPGAITGTVSDSATGSHGISSVNVSIQDSSSGKCWNGANFTTASCPNYVPVTSGGSAAGAANANWSYTLAAAALTNGDTYTVQIQATDATTNGNTSGNLAAGTFTYDTAAPSSAVLSSNGNYNAAGWPGAVSGTVSDSGTGSHGISAVNVSIQDSTTGKCWNGANFTTAACPNYVPVTSGGSAAGAANANWSYNLVTATLTNGDTYTVQIQATDATTNGNTSGNLAAGTFTYDTAAPSSATLISNGNYNVAGWPGAITGTVSDSGTGSHGIGSVNVSIQDSTSGKCWNGTNFTTASCPNYVAVTSGGSAAGAANANWSYTLASAALTNGDTYTVQVQATDATTNGNTSGNLAAGTFTYDTSAPSSATLASNGSYNAAGWPGAISGTVSDSGTGSHGISAVTVSIQDSGTGKCWNGTNFTTTACQNWLAVTSGGSAAGAANANWTYTLASGALTDGHTYTVSVQATDATTSGNQSGTLAAGTFVYDTAAPNSATLTSNATYNAAGWPGAISGTVSDSGTGSHGISAVTVSIQDSGTGKCWNGTNFTTTACQNWLAVTSGGSAAGAANANWTYTLASGALTDGHTYTVSVQATDATTSGNQSGTVTAGTFTYDSSAPSSATLTSNGVYNAAGWPGAITGTVSDSGTGSHGIGSVNVSIQDSTSGRCWNGTNFTTTACQNWLAVTSGGSAAGAANANWSYTLAAGALTDGHSYTVSVQATDGSTSGNQSGTLAAGSFTYDTSAPSSATLSSNGNYNAAGWPGAISGTVSDSGTGGHGISAVNVSIQDSGTGKCWNGTNFTTTACQNWLAVTSGGSAAGAGNANWSYTLAAGALTDGHTYTVSVQATDATTSGNQSGTLAAGTFTYDTSNPTGSISFPANAAHYNASSWSGTISGSATDSGSGGHGIASTQISIQKDGGASTCWDGTNGAGHFGAACPNWVTVTNGTAVNSGTASWTSTLGTAALVDGASYQTTLRTTDGTTSGNQNSSAAASTFTYDTTAPVLTTAVTNSAGTTLTLNYSEALDTGSTPAAGDFTLEYQPANGGAWTSQSITGVSVSGSAVTLSLATPPNDSQAVRISYTAGTNPVRDLSLNNAAALSQQPVTNLTTDTVAPSRTSMSTNAAGTQLTINYDEPLDTGSTPAAGDFVLEYQPANGGSWISRSITGVSVSGSTVVLTLATPPNDSQAVRLTYTGGTNKTRDASSSHNNAANFSQQAVTNNTTDTVAPTVTGVTATDGNGAYKAGQTIHVQVNFSEHVVVTGTPQLQLSTGSTVNYSSGSGTSTLEFDYTIQAGDTSADLDANATNALTLNGGAIKDGTGNNATQTLVVGAGNAGSLANAKNIVVDTTNPTVHVTTPAADGTYYRAATLPGNLVGDSSDSTAGIASLQIAIQDGSGNYWDGSDFTQSGITYNAASGTTSWTYSTGTLAGKLTDGHTYTITAKATDAAGNSSTTTRTFTYDTTAPTAPVGFTFTGISNGYWPGSGSIVYFQGGNSGGFTVTASGSTDGGSGVAGYTYPSLSGWSNTGGVYTFTSGSTTQSGSVTAQDVAGNTSTGTSFTAQSDTTAPTGGAFSANGTAASGAGTSSYLTSGTTLTIDSRTDFAETQSSTESGLAYSTLSIRSATLTGNSCGTYGAPSTITGTTSQTVASGNCYLLTLTGADNVGNQATPISTTVKVDTTGPTAPTTFSFGSLSGSAYWPGSGSIVYFQGGTGGGFTATASGSADSDTGVASYTYGAIAGGGWSNSTGAYTFTGASPTGSASVTATNSAGVTGAAASFSAQSDPTAPTGGAFSANGTAASGVGTSSYLTSGTTLTIDSRTDYTETQTSTASGFASSVLTIKSATLSGNSCGSYGSATTITGTTSQTVASGNCYKLTLTGTDNVGNAASVSTVVKVDTSAPSAPSSLAFSAPDARVLPGRRLDRLLPGRRLGRLHGHRKRLGRR